MVWDPDINPEGLAEQWKHTFVFGGEAPAPPSYSKDGKAVVAPKPPEAISQARYLRELRPIRL